MRDRRTFLKTATLATGMTLLGGAWRSGHASERGVGSGPTVDAFLRAVGDGDVSAVEAALARQATLAHAQDAEGRSAFALALLAGHPSVGDVLVQAGFAPDLHESALAGDWERFSTLAEAAPEQVDADHAIGGSVMLAAARGGAGTQIWRAYAAGAHPNVNPRGANGMTPLRAAFEFPDRVTAEMSAATLLANGADPNVPTANGDTPLHAAARRGATDLVEYLLRKGARTDVRNGAAHTPLEAARDANATAAIRLLQREASLLRHHSTSRIAYDAEGRPYRAPDLSAFALAETGRVVGAAHGDFDTVRAAIEDDPRLAHARATTTEGAVEASAHMGRTEMVSYLLERGAPYALPTAVVRGDAARVTALLEEDPLRVRERGAHDFPLLWYPVIGGERIDMMERLLAFGADIEESHWMGTTALHYAALGGQADMVAFLLDRGANVMRVGRKFDPAGQTPLQLASARGRESIVRLLRDRGAEG